ncbi:hypothetical protein M404DRAFT_994062, partial [Pisolithus tinctorius Marx 270]
MWLRSLQCSAWFDHELLVINIEALLHSKKVIESNGHSSHFFQLHSVQKAGSNFGGKGRRQNFVERKIRQKSTSSEVTRIFSQSCLSIHINILPRPSPKTPISRTRSTPYLANRRGLCIRHKRDEIISPLIFLQF